MLGKTKGCQASRAVSSGERAVCLPANTIAACLFLVSLSLTVSNAAKSNAFSHTFPNTFSSLMEAQKESLDSLLAGWPDWASSTGG